MVYGVIDFFLGRTFIRKTDRYKDPGPRWRRGMKPVVIATIAARGGSKGVPNKNIRNLAGRPLVSFMIEKARCIKSIDKIIVSTDSPKIAEIAAAYHAPVSEMRPERLSGDRVPLIDVTKYLMNESDKEGPVADIVVQLQPTCPFITEQSIETAIDKVISGEWDSAVSLKKIEHEHPYRARVRSACGDFRNFIQDIDVEARCYQSRQDLPQLFCTSGALYVRRRKLLDEYDGNSFALGVHRYGVVTDDIEAVNIDREIDFKFAEFLVQDGLKDEYLPNRERDSEF